MKKTETYGYNMEQEIWKDVKGFEGLYQASSFGNIMSLGRKRMLINGGYIIYPKK